LSSFGDDLWEPKQALKDLELGSGVNKFMLYYGQLPTAVEHEGLIQRKGFAVIRLECYLASGVSLEKSLTKTRTRIEKIAESYSSRAVRYGIGLANKD
jgi:hypothetical protein